MDKQKILDAKKALLIADSKLMDVGINVNFSSLLSLLIKMYDENN